MFEHIPTPSFESMNLGINKVANYDPSLMFLLLFVSGLGLGLVYMALRSWKKC